MSSKPELRSKENVLENGEVFTPFSTVDDMLSMIPDSAWVDPTHCFLEPTCGNGQFLLRVIAKRIEAGLTIDLALNSLIGMDISEENISTSHTRLMEYTYDHLSQKYPINSSFTYKYANCVRIIKNNIFLVADSLQVMEDYKNGKGILFDKSFILDDYSI